MSFTPNFAQQTPPSPPSYNYSPPMATLLIVLIILFFTVGFISVYIRHFALCLGIRLGRNAHGRVDGWSRWRPRGLDSSVVDTFPTFLYSDVKVHRAGKSSLECAICLSEFSDHEVLRMLPICNHVFHPNCIEPWLRSHVTCPICRANLEIHVHSSRSIDSLANHLEQSSEDELSEPSDQITCHGDNHGRDVIVQIGVSPLTPENTIKTPVHEVKGVGSGMGKLPRSHSTGHSLVEDCERYTLRLPEEVRNKLVNVNLSGLPAAIVSPRIGYRATSVGCTGMPVKPDRWWLSASPPFISRRSLTTSPINNNNNNLAGRLGGPRNIFRSFKSPLNRGDRCSDIGERSSDKLWPNKPSQESELEDQ